MKGLTPLLLVLVLLVAGGGAAAATDSQLNRGVKNDEVEAYRLINRAQQNPAEAKDLLKQAVSVAPDLPRTYIELSFASLSPSAGGILDSIDYLIQGINAYGRNFWWSLTLYGALFLSLILSFVLAAAVVFVVRAFPDIPLLAHDVQENARLIPLFPALIVLGALSPLLFLGGCLILIGMYMKRIDRIVVYAYLVFLACTPLLLKTASSYFTTVSSGDFKAIVQVNQSEGNSYAETVLRQDGNFTVTYSKALALKRDGQYDEAIRVFRGLLERQPDPRIYVNIGDCYVGLYNFEETKKPQLEEAMKYYGQAIGLKPLASAYYNLSQVSRELLDFPKGEEYFRNALAIDRNAVAEYRSVSGRTPNRMVADEPLSRKELWQYIRGSGTRMSTLGLSHLPAPALTVVAFGLLVAFYLLSTVRHQKAYRCRKCNTILCEQCEKQITWGQMCPQCFGSLVKLQELDARERVARILTIYEQQQAHRKILKVLAYVLPGVSLIYAGKVLYGFVLLWPFLFCALLPITNALCVPGSLLVSHSVFSLAAVVLAALLYAVSLMITNRRIARGWL